MAIASYNNDILQLTNVDNLYLLLFQEPEHGSEVFQHLRLDDGTPVVAADLARARNVLDQFHEDQAVSKVGLEVADLSFCFLEVPAEGIIDPLRERRLLQELPVFIDLTRHLFSLDL